jgi:signal transduction histidine kinase/CheY-like chemotaxis protein
MIKESISTQLMRIVFLCYCLVAITVTAVHVFEEYRQTQINISQELISYQNIFGPVLGKSMWHLDRERIEDVMNAMNLVPVIKGVKINKVGEDKIFMAQGMVMNDHLETLLYQGGQVTVLGNQEDLFYYQFSVVYEYAGVGHELAEVTLYSNSSVVFDRVKTGFIFLVINSIIKGIALWIIFYWFSNKIILRPLNKLASTVKEISFNDMGGLKKIQVTRKNNELRDLQLSFSEMIREIEESKFQIMDLNNNLFEKVKTKTQQIEMEKQKVVDALEVKTNFLATMSHEIRTPLNGVIGMLTLLKAAELDGNSLNKVKLAQDSAKTLMLLINDILDYSKIESGNLKLENNAICLQDEVSDILDVNRILVHQKGLELEADSKNLDAFRVLGDSLRLGQIMNNLLSNAIKFTSQGDIKVSCELYEDQLNDEYCTLRVSIQDSGIGIAPENIAGLFQVFTQADASTTRQFGGTGLGLAIVKDLCELMGGRVWVKSTLDVGSCFSFEVRFQKVLFHEPIDKNTDESLSRPLPSAKILLVEDNLINQEVALDMLATLGQQVSLAQNGQEALKALQESDFDLVLMDCQMPIMDGYEATQFIRSKLILALGKGTPIPIIAMTANAMDGDMEKCLEVGMSDYLSKPVDIKALERKLRRYLNSPSQ